MKRTASVDYIMEDPREAARLEAKVDPQGWVQKYLSGLLHPGAKLLSVGCGPGAIDRAVCEYDSTVRTTGLDASLERIEEATRKAGSSSRMKFVCGDACNMPFADNSFDIVYSRLMIEYVPDKERALAEMARVCKRGGRVLVQDLDGQLLWHYPEDPQMQAAVEKVVAGLGKTGFDAFVGRKLFWLARKAGLVNLDVQIESYHAIAGEADAVTLEQWALKFDIARPQMARILGSDAEAEKQSRKFLEYLSRPDTLTYSVQFSVTGEKRS